LSATFAVSRTLLLGRLREQPFRLLATVLAIALGVALSTAVFLINQGALQEFDRAARQLVGDADIVLRGGDAGFDESLFVALATDPAVVAASPMLDLAAQPMDGEDSLPILGLDPLRAGQVQPLLLAGLGDGLLPLLQPDAVALSASAAEQLGLSEGGRLRLRAGSEVIELRVVKVLTEEAYPQPLALMDIASAQWRFDRIGRINRLDLRLRTGIEPERFLAALAARLPVGVTATGPGEEAGRAERVSRAYRVNLNLLAMVALLTGGFLVFSTQSLAVLRRRQSFALLRALGCRRGELEVALLAEGALLGVTGAALGVVLGQALAVMVLVRLGGDLGGGYFATLATRPDPQASSLLPFFLVGTALAMVGAWWPAREAARRAPALALKSGDAEIVLARMGGVRAGLMLAGVAVLLALLPAVGGLPLFGYLAVAALLFAGILLVPALTARVLAVCPVPRRATPAVALAQLRGSAGLSAISLAAIIVSFSLMAAMAIMVHSFRDSFERWLGDVLPADLHARVAATHDTAYWDEADQAAIARLPGVSHVEWRRLAGLRMDALREPVELIARPVGVDGPVTRLPLVAGTLEPTRGSEPVVWISEPVSDLYGWRVGELRELPLADGPWPVRVAGIWRDYGHPAGAIVVSLEDYRLRTGDLAVNQAAFWLEPGVEASEVETALRGLFAEGALLQVYRGDDLRQRSLAYFDRAFAVTYALEAVAVAIGLMGVSFALSAQALARRREFGVLRHLGMLRSQVLALLASEGGIMGLLGAAYGLLLGFLISLVLVYVVNRQAFNWSIDLSLPVGQLLVVALGLVLAAVLTGALSGRRATSVTAVRAVRDDW
jgi:putative ABC transport system permease protein